MNFSHIFIEEEIADHPRIHSIKSIYPHAKIISINNYKNVFNPTNQNFQVQKLDKKLILAKKRDQFYYPGSPITDTLKRGRFYYNSLIMNCFYNCEYCYLQGMYNSSHIVIFINLEDFFKHTLELLEREEKITICISYDTDLLALERVIPYTKEWLQFASRHSNLNIEVRTKSNNYSMISHISAIPNVTLAWTLSPNEIVSKYEHDTPTLNRRLDSLRSAIKDGWNTRICLDPILHIRNWKSIYKDFLLNIFSYPEIASVNEITFGVFRINSDYLKKIKKMRTDSELIYYPFKKIGNIDTYKKEIEDEIKNFIYTEIANYLPEEKIFY